MKICARNVLVDIKSQSTKESKMIEGIDGTIKSDFNTNFGIQLSISRSGRRKTTKVYFF